MKDQRNLDNLYQLAQQIQMDKERKEVQKIIEKQYYKPHFGPEETDSTVIKEEMLRHSKK